MSAGEGNTFPRNPFWDFSLAVYGREGVAAACLALQDRRHADVNVLLFCCWVAASGRGVLDAAGIETALALVRPWQDEVVAPLRSARKRLKHARVSAPGTTLEALRRRVADAELDAEHVEQLMLAATRSRGAGADVSAAGGPADAAANLRSYFDAMGVAVGETDLADLTALLAGVFEASERADLDSCLRAKFLRPG